MLVLTCDCTHRMKVANDMVGKSVRCSKCNGIIRITRRNTESLDVVAARAVAASGSGKKKIGEMLIEAGLITDGQLKDALRVQETRGGKLVEQLVSLGHIDPDAFVRFLSNQPGVASLDLRNYRISHDIVSLIPVELAVKHEIFPIDRLGKLLTLGMVCPLDGATIKQIEDMTGLRVKPILCSPDDIRKCLHDYYPEEFGDPLETLSGVRKHDSSIRKKKPDTSPPEKETSSDADQASSSMKLQRAATLISQIKSLPALPQTVQRVREAMTDVKIGARDVAEIILQDPPVAAKVLQVANSAAYGFAREVDSVELAIALIGLRETSSIVTSAALMKLLEKGDSADYRAFWDEAMVGAAAVREIGNACGQQNLEGLSTAGLLRDIGRIVLMELVPQQYEKINSDLVGEELVQAEQEAIGIAHTEAGFELAKNWAFPQAIAECIRFHHSPEFAEAAKPQVAIVALSELWTRTCPAESTDRDDVLARSAELFEILKMDETAAKSAYDAVANLGAVGFNWDA